MIKRVGRSTGSARAGPWGPGARPPAAAGEIHQRIAAELGAIAHFHVHSRTFPPFRFVDVYDAITKFCGEGYAVTDDLSGSAYDLVAIVADGASAMGGPPQYASTHAWPVGFNQETYLPSDRFWICKAQGSSKRSIIVRLRFNVFADVAQIEVATEIATDGPSAINDILDLSSRESIYRNQIISLSFTNASSLDDDVEKPPRLRVEFRAFEPVTDADMFIDEETRRTLLRNVVELQTRREILKANGVPSRRGTLLYGPPGTGKSYACRYICSKATNATRLIVAGQALYHVGPIFSLARLLQPTILFLEDVDLIVPSRDLYPVGNSILADLLDHMDGLRSHEEITVVITTNSIQRMESAIRERPGRVSQLVYFGPASPEQREAFLANHLRQHDTTALDIKALAADSDGATHAFLKEWVRRAIQVACQDLQSATERPSLLQQHFAEALAEMNRFADQGRTRFMGFLREPRSFPEA